MKYKVLLIGLSALYNLHADTNDIVYKYRIYCVTESQNVYEWNTAAPTTCPNNTAHTINPNSISVVDQRSPAIVSIKQESVPTGGFFKTETILINAATGPDVVTTVTHSWPFNISLLNLYFQTEDSNTGDSFTLEWATDLPIGILAQNLAAGATTASVTADTLQNLAIGFNVAFSDGINSDECGRITSIDSINSAITFESATIHSFSASSPTLVQITVTPIENLLFGPATQYNIAKEVIGGSHFPANQVATAYYTNNSAEAKKLYVNLEYLY